MDSDKAIGKRKIIPTSIRVAAYLLAVTLIFSVISVLCSVDTTDVYPSEDGIVDLTGIDFDGETVSITSDAIHIYDLAFYTPEDFASGRVTQESVRVFGVGPSLKDYGTIRILLKLPPGVYAISAKNTSYAQRLFINGEEYEPIGVTGDSAESVVPKATRYTATFASQGGTTEIVLHYSNFVHSDAGGFYPIELSSAENIASNGQLKAIRITAVTAALVTAMLFFFGMFLFFGKSRYFLWFSLACGCIALRGLLIDDKAIMLLLPDLNWYLAIRLEYLTTCGTALFSVLYLNDLFPRAANKWVLRCFTVFCAANAAFVCLTPPLVFTRFVTATIWIYALFGVYLLTAILVSVLYIKRPAVLLASEQVLLLVGCFIYLLLSALGIHSHMFNTRLLWGLDYPETGMMVFLFINILALTLGFARTERDLDSARQAEREMQETNHMLARLDRLRTDFLANISHEIKTPLTVADGFAQYTLSQINEGTVGEDTKENLRLISREVGRLSELADGLLRVSADMAWERRVVSVAAVIERAAATCRPILAKNDNRLEIRIEDNLPPVRVNGDMIHQVLLNLAVNANKHTRGGEVVISGVIKDGMTAIAVSDNGKGIDPVLLPQVFERRVSGGDGAGLGLALCKEIIDIHNGRITIESTPDTGTRVTFTLPREEEAGHESNDTVN